MSQAPHRFLEGQRVQVLKTHPVAPAISNSTYKGFDGWPAAPVYKKQIFVVAEQARIRGHPTYVLRIEAPEVWSAARTPDTVQDEWLKAVPLGATPVAASDVQAAAPTPLVPGDVWPVAAGPNGFAELPFRRCTHPLLGSTVSAYKQLLATGLINHWRSTQGMYVVLWPHPISWVAAATPPDFIRAEHYLNFTFGLAGSHSPQFPLPDSSSPFLWRPFKEMRQLSTSNEGLPCALIYAECRPSEYGSRQQRGELERKLARMLSRMLGEGKLSDCLTPSAAAACRAVGGIITETIRIPWTEANAASIVSAINTLRDAMAEASRTPEKSSAFMQSVVDCVA